MPLDPHKTKPIESLDALAVPEHGAALSATQDAAVALARSVEPEAATDALKARILASSQRAGTYGVFADRVARIFDLPVDEVYGLLRSLEDPASWRPGITEGIDMIPVMAGPKHPGAIATFTKLRPGATFPRHAHVGDEVTLVMAGGFRDSSGVEIERGDELYEASGSTHDFVVLEGEDCIAAVIIDGYIDLV